MQLLGLTERGWAGLAVGFYLAGSFLSGALFALALQGWAVNLALAGEVAFMVFGATYLIGTEWEETRTH